MSRSEGKPRLGGQMLGVLVLLVTLVLGLGTYPAFLGVSKPKDGPALAKLGFSLPETLVPLRFLVLAGDSPGLRLKIKALDLGGRELGLLERSFEGPGLGIDLVSRKLGPASTGGKDRILLFPRVVFAYDGAGAEKEAARLFDLYDREGLPAIYLDSGARGDSRGDPSQAKALARLFASARGDSSSSSLVHVLLPGVEAGAVYELRLPASGNPLLIKVPAF